MGGDNEEDSFSGFAVSESIVFVAAVTACLEIAKPGTLRLVGPKTMRVNTNYVHFKQK